jgi:hypothetical protein
MFRSKRLSTLGSWLALAAMFTLALPLQGGAAPVRAAGVEGMPLAGATTGEAGVAARASALPPCHVAAFAAGAAVETGDDLTALPVTKGAGDSAAGAATPNCEHFPESVGGCHCVQWVAVAAPGLIPLGLTPSAPPLDTVMLFLPPRFVAADFRPPISSPR